MNVNKGITSGKIKLAESDIDLILEEITFFYKIPKEINESLININKEKLKKQLLGLEIYRELIPKLKTELTKKFLTSVITPGESVGIQAAQSIGERLTQTTLDAFHTAGKSEKATSSGVTRLQEIMNATKKYKQKSLSAKIEFLQPCNTVSELRKHIGNKIIGVQLSEIINDFEFHLDMEKQDWYDMYRILYQSEYDEEMNVCIRCNFNKLKMLKYNISLLDVASSIELHFEDVYPIASPDELGIIDLYVDCSDIKLPENIENLLYVSNENKYHVYLEECVWPLLEKFVVSGIEGITHMYFSKSENGNWFIETEGSELKKLLNIDIVDKKTVVSNNAWEILEVFGIEAARQFLIDEYCSIMEGVNVSHVMLLVERMTYTGTISSISRYTMRDDDVGPCSRASFEESLDQFCKAAVYGEKENTSGISASIICGKRPEVGSGMMSLMVDANKLLW